jgi:CO/xanthine dehydrogenase Mo-binding subunit
VTKVNLHEYKIPSMADLPDFQAVLLAPDLSLGLTPIGEGANAGMAPALTNAVVDVIGPHALNLPLDPEVVRRLAQSGGASTRDREHVELHA